MLKRTTTNAASVTAPFSTRIDPHHCGGTIVPGYIIAAAVITNGHTMASPQIHIMDDHGDCLVLTIEQYDAIQRIDLKETFGLATGRHSDETQVTHTWVMEDDDPETVDETVRKIDDFFAHCNEIATDAQFPRTLDENWNKD